MDAVRLDFPTFQDSSTNGIMGSPQRQVPLRRGHFFSGWLRVCLVLSTWNAPLPVIHSHEGRAAEAEILETPLTRHLHRFHSQLSQQGECAHWHIHWVLPAEWALYPCRSHSPEETSDVQSFALRAGSAVPCENSLTCLRLSQPWEHIGVAGGERCLPREIRAVRWIGGLAGQAPGEHCALGLCRLLGRWAC